MFLFHPSIVFLFHRYTISSYLTEVINDLIFIIIIKSFFLCELSLLLMCNSELQKTKSLVWSWWGLRYDYFVGSFPWGLIVLVFLRFSFRLIRFPRKTELLPGRYFACLAVNILEANAGEKARQSQHSLCMVSLFSTVFLLSAVCALLPFGQRVFILPSLENKLLVICWNWERTAI